MKKKTQQDERLLTLTDVFYELKGMPSGGVSMPSLIKYKKQHAVAGGILEKYARGTGGSMRFTPAAVPVFLKLKKDGEKRRGRPRKVQQ